MVMLSAKIKHLYKGYKICQMHALFTPFQRTNQYFHTGSKEKAELKKALSELKAKVTEVPLYINGQEILTDSKDTVVCPHNHSHVLAKVSQAKRRTCSSCSEISS